MAIMLGVGTGGVGECMRVSGSNAPAWEHASGSHQQGPRHVTPDPAGGSAQDSGPLPGHRKLIKDAPQHTTQPLYQPLYLQLWVKRKPGAERPCFETERHVHLLNRPVTYLGCTKCLADWLQCRLFSEFLARYSHCIMWLLRNALIAPTQPLIG